MLPFNLYPNDCLYNKDVYFDIIGIISKLSLLENVIERCSLYGQCYLTLDKGETSIGCDSGCTIYVSFGILSQSCLC